MSQKILFTDATSQMGIVLQPNQASGPRKNKGGGPNFFQADPNLEGKQFRHKHFEKKIHVQNYYFKSIFI
jgi:hypothetical protein